MNLRDAVDAALNDNPGTADLDRLSHSVVAAWDPDQINEAARRHAATLLHHATALPGARAAARRATSAYASGITTSTG